MRAGPSGPAPSSGTRARGTPDRHQGTMLAAGLGATQSPRSPRGAPAAGSVRGARPRPGLPTQKDDPMIRISSRTRRLAGAGALVAGAFATAALGTAPASRAPAPPPAPPPPPRCWPAPAPGRRAPARPGSPRARRRRSRSSTPTTRPRRTASSRTPRGCRTARSTSRTVFHVVSDHTLTAPERTRMQTMIAAQMTGAQRLLRRPDRPDRGRLAVPVRPAKIDVHREHALVHRRARARPSGT